MREEADNRNDVSLRTQEDETEVRTRVATMKSVAKGRRRGNVPSVQGAEGFASCVAAPPLSKTVVVSDDGSKMCVSAAAEARATASMTAAAEMQCDRYVV